MAVQHTLGITHCGLRLNTRVLDSEIIVQVLLDASDQCERISLYAIAGPYDDASAIEYHADTEGALVMRCCVAVIVARAGR